MRQIIKTSPPTEFVEYCKTPGVSYEGLGGEYKKALRKRLLEDQGYICCYCGKRIKDDKHTKIEHIKCQKNYPDLSLDFNNMLVSCDGGEKDREDGVVPRHKVHCDAKKGNEEIPISPLDHNIKKYLFYFDDGTIKGKGEIGKELIRILGLDNVFLNTQRKNAIGSYEIKFPDDIEKELKKLRDKDKNGCLEEFCFVLEQYIMETYEVELK